MGDKMSKNIRILITDYHCASNRGDAAILEGVVASLKEYFSNPKIIVLTKYPNSARFINDVHAIDQVMFPFRWIYLKKNILGIYTLIAALFRKWGVLLPGMKTINKKLSLEPYINADLIVCTGGSFLNDFYVPENLGRLWGIYYAKLLGKPVVLYAQSIGPLNKSVYRPLFRYVLNKVDLITLRDRKSLKILKSAGINKPPIHVTADAAFTMTTTTSKPLQLLRCENIPKVDKSCLNISISIREWSYLVKSNGHKNYIDTIAALADWLIEEKNAKIYFLSTCTGFDEYNHDDRTVAHEIINLMKYSKKNNPVILCGEYIPQELSLIYGHMDLHIGTRMHSNILAMLAKTPVVAIQYEFKTTGLMEVFELENYVVNMNDIKYIDLKEKVDKALTNRKQLKKQIIKKLPGIIIKSKYSAKLTFDLMKRKGLIT